MNILYFFEAASDAFETVWNNQWEPSTAKQDASIVYQARFGTKGHSNKDINTVPTNDIPNHDLLVGGFPCQDYSDYINRPSRTIITGEGGSSPSRFKHVIKTKSGRYRRLIPLELERLNMFPDNHTYHPDVSDSRRAFLMGNALVCGIVERIGKSLYEFI